MYFACVFVCVDLTDDMRKQFPLMAAIASRTRVFPNQRITRLLEFNRNICSNPNNMNSLHEWDLTLDNKLVEIEGHILPQEKIFFNNDSVYAGEQANWTSSMNNKVLILAKRLQYWAIICVKESRQIWERFQQILIFEANKIGFRISYPSIRYFVDKNDRVLFNKMMEDIASKEPLQLVVCVDSRIHFKRYCALKTKFCVDRPIPSQMIVLNGKKENLLTSLAKKLAIQINCKLGGVPWYVDIPIEGLMVIGFDVCHDRRKVECDFGATVGSLDNKLTKYISAVSKHNKGEELSNDIANHICKFISRYRDNNDNKYPDYIIIYRDGVGEGQIESVYNHEVKKIKKKLDEMYKDVEIKMAFIIVNKRVNTRIFYNQRNPPCGTVVDSVITSPTANDFFIVSQHVLQGTVTPTSYTVIYNSLELHESMIQQITYKLTHMYYNWSGTIRIPAPCQYAHKLAHLVGVYIGEEPHNDIEDLLYYL
ncbi:piwi-like protein Siwi isoform X3 [Vespula squamosa]|uniref:Piwi-like protein Siwi isoform X3 n=1 Tax=Vespula squamosa TaxID=30214 RepID=A0ABD1ZTZ9_VESSQ